MITMYVYVNNHIIQYTTQIGKRKQRERKRPTHTISKNTQHTTHNTKPLRFRKICLVKDSLLKISASWLTKINSQSLCGLEKYLTISQPKQFRKVDNTNIYALDVVSIWTFQHILTIDGREKHLYLDY